MKDDWNVLHDKSQSEESIRETQKFFFVID